MSRKRTKLDQSKSHEFFSAFETCYYRIRILRRFFFSRSSITQSAPVPNPPPGTQLNQGILQPPGAGPLPPPLPQIPGLVRQMGMPPQGMMMQNLQRVGPLLGPPGGFNFPTTGTMPPRPPLLPQAPPPIPGTIKPSGPPPPLLKQPPPPAEEEPAAKKLKSLEDALIPEAQFLALNRSPATFTVVCPSVLDKPEMNLSGKFPIDRSGRDEDRETLGTICCTGDLICNLIYNLGQIISVTMGLSEPISLIKTKVAELIGLAPGKQKLSTEGLFFKDSNTLAFYNIGDRTTVHLSLKERGGRKK